MPAVAPHVAMVPHVAIQNSWVMYANVLMDTLEITVKHVSYTHLKGCRMGRSDKVSLWYVTLLINTRFRFFILE